MSARTSVRPYSTLLATLTACAIGTGTGTETGPSPPSAASASVTDGAAPSGADKGAMPPTQAGPLALSQQMDRARIAADVAAIALPRVPGSQQWQMVQDLCASRLKQYGFDVELHRYDTGVNVIGVRKGTTDPSHQVILGAHYDGVPDCPAADDNASGVAAALEAARVMSAAVFPHTLVITCWDEEETGLLGSQAQASRASDRGDTIDVVYSLETISYKDDAENTQDLPTGFGLLFPDVEKATEASGNRGNFLMAFADPHAAPPLAALGAYANQIGLPFIPVAASRADLLNPALLTLHRSDHAPFWWNGFPAMMITDTANYRNKAYHCFDDLQDVATRNDYGFATMVAQAVVASAAETLGLPRDLPASP